jgi:hypothetical protein
MAKNSTAGRTGMRRRLFLNLGLCALSSSCALLMGELGVRVAHGKLFTVAKARPDLDDNPDAARGVYDAYLGYVPKPGRYVGTFVATVTPEGLRRSAGKPPAGDAVLAIGDSFVFGDDVNDNESWPAYLESMLSRPVFNGGVFGYGLDQAVLRAELLIEELRPKTVVISLIADDLERCEMSYRYCWKPYFQIVNGALHRENDPVPMAPRPISYAVLHGALSYSYLAHAVFRRAAPSWWYLGRSETRVHHDGEKVGMLLVDRLARYAQKHSTNVLVVSQCDGFLDADSLVPILAGARASGMETLDVAGELRRLLSDDEELHNQFYTNRRGGLIGGHHSSSGNRWVARRVAAHLKTLGW